MSRKIWFLAPLIAVTVFGSPARSDLAAEFANQVRSDLAGLSTTPGLTLWKRSHPGGKVELAHYEAANDSYQIDFAQMNRWCAASVSNLPTQTVRTALFYVPSVNPGALPPLPNKEDAALTNVCRLETLWYEAGGDISMDALVKEFSSFWGSPVWKQGAAVWHWKGINIQFAQNRRNKPGVPGLRLIVKVGIDFPYDSASLIDGLLSAETRNQITRRRGADGSAGFSLDCGYVGPHTLSHTSIKAGR